MSYGTLDIWKLVRQATIDIHKMTLTKLPKFEMFEEGAQIRRSVKSIRSNIVEVMVGGATSRNSSNFSSMPRVLATRRLTTLKHCLKPDH